VESEEQLAEARVRLARVGIEDLDGYLDGGVRAWKAAGFPLATLRQISPAELSEKLGQNRLQVLDVRREPEWEAGHIAGATWWPLDNFKVAPPEIDRDVPVAVHCKGGYRSMIACSLLQRAGFKNVFNLVGGFDAWQQAKLPVTKEVADEKEKPVEA
jgi:hydroxyacylglutathione hydrolase